MGPGTVLHYFPCYVKDIKRMYQVPILNWIPTPSEKDVIVDIVAVPGNGFRIKEFHNRAQY